MAKQATPKKRNRWTWPQDRPKNREISSESETVAGEAFTIQELMARSVAQGGLQQVEGTYLDAPIEEINHLYRMGLDLTDVQAHRDHINQLTQKLEEVNELQRQQKLAEQEKDKKEFEEYKKNKTKKPTETKDEVE